MMTDECEANFCRLFSRRRRAMKPPSGPREVQADVRMRGFARRVTVEAAHAWLDAQLRPLTAESVPLETAAGRVLSHAAVSPVDVPTFDRAMMDGFAVRAHGIAGASAYNPIVLDVVGEAFPGRPYAGEVAAAQAVKIMTGAPMPDGADAVLPFELAEFAQGRVRALGEVSPGKHVGARGEDVTAGTTVLPPGRLLRPQDVGLLSSVGIGRVECIGRVRVAIVLTGSELLPPGTPPGGCKITDANGPMLQALVERDGGSVISREIVPDNRQQIAQAIKQDADVVLVSGGSSVGQDDHVPTILAEQGELAVHGVAMRPSSPTGMGRLGERLVFLLPGNPVSCLCAYDFFAGRAIRGLGGRQLEWPYRSLRGKLARKINSEIGRLDYTRVTVAEGQVFPLAIGGASILSSTTRADGFVVVPADSEGYPPGAEVEVFLYQ
jgi:molybdopterin molybdotransferase